jgi:hypothetical protein
MIDCVTNDTGLSFRHTKMRLLFALLLIVFQLAAAYTIRQSDNDSFLTLENTDNIESKKGLNGTDEAEMKWEAKSLLCTDCPAHIMITQPLSGQIVSANKELIVKVNTDNGSPMRLTMQSVPDRLFTSQASYNETAPAHLMRMSDNGKWGWYEVKVAVGGWSGVYRICAHLGETVDCLRVRFQ